MYLWLQFLYNSPSNSLRKKKTKKKLHGQKTPQLRKGASNGSNKNIYNYYLSTHITTSAPTLLPQHPHYYLSTHITTSAPTLLPQHPHYYLSTHITTSAPTLLPQHPHYYLSTHITTSAPTLLPQHPHYYLSTHMAQVKAVLDKPQEISDLHSSKEFSLHYFQVCFCLEHKLSANSPCSNINTHHCAIVLGDTVTTIKSGTNKVSLCRRH